MKNTLKCFLVLYLVSCEHQLKGEIVHHHTVGNTLLKVLQNSYKKFVNTVLVEYQLNFFAFEDVLVLCFYYIIVVIHVLLTN